MRLYVAMLWLLTSANAFAVYQLTDVKLYQYYLSDDNGYLGQVKLLENKSIRLLGKTSIPAVSWQFDTKANLLSFLDVDKKTVVIFTSVKKDYFQKWRLSGLCLGNKFPPYSNYYLEQLI